MASGVDPTKLRNLTLPCGKRQLTFAVYGRSYVAGGPVGLWFHGTPSCCMEAEVVEEAAAALGVSMLAFDRPGIGTSSPDPRCTVLSVVADALALLDAVCGPEAAVTVFGCSGGGPYAAALAALAPTRVQSLTLIAPLGPTSGKHRHLLRGVEGADALQLRAVRWRLGLVWGMHSLLRYMANNHAGKLLEYAPKGMAAPDGELLATHEGVRGGFATCLQHAYTQGARGMAHDVAVLRSDWRVDVSSIRCRTTIWHGSEDRSVPLSHSRWYQAQIGGSELHVLEGEGHVTVSVKYPREILAAAFPGLQPQRSAAAAAAAGGGQGGGDGGAGSAAH